MEWLDSFTPLTLYSQGKGDPGTRWIRGWVCPPAGLHAVVMRIILPLPAFYQLSYVFITGEYFE
jgi:hypothetical protein